MLLSTRQKAGAIFKSYFRENHSFPTTRNEATNRPVQHTYALESLSARQLFLNPNMSLRKPLFKASCSLKRSIYYGRMLQRCTNGLNKMHSGFCSLAYWSVHPGTDVSPLYTHPKHQVYRHLLSIPHTQGNTGSISRKRCKTKGKFRKGLFIWVLWGGELARRKVERQLKNTK